MLTASSLETIPNNKTEKDSNSHSLQNLALNFEEITVMTHQEMPKLEIRKH